MTAKRLLMIIIALSIFVSSQCYAFNLMGWSNGHDKDYIPYKLTGFTVYLYDEQKAPNADYYVGAISCTYSDRATGLSKARSMAYAAAKRLNFHIDQAGRFYVICTVTKKSSCATKVR